MVGGGERPAYRLRRARDGPWTVFEAPWLALHATCRREALADARQLIRDWLGCDSTAFNIAVDDAS
jgi:hypothetical protein